MSSDLPPDAVGFRIAAVVPCDGATPCHVMPGHAPRPWDGGCPGCLGDGTRVVVTDVEVERHETIRAWREVPR